jgi:acyl-CoA synthetase (AMP-forming)/AMP-acid ligase II/acyl carrier protein
LDERARAIAAEVRRFAEPGDRALLVYPPGLDFVAGFFGCMYAGVLAVPCNYPRPKRPMPRHAAIAADSQARVALTSSQALELMDLSTDVPQFQALDWIATDKLPVDSSADWQVFDAAADDVAFLQYTSGSTSKPKGVLVTHRGVLHNLEVIRQGFGLPSIHPDDPEKTSLIWLPTYHDMGLVGGLLATLYSSRHAVFMSPASFLQRPLRWLRAISEYRGAVNGAPTFAYDLCVEKTTPKQRATLDLSCWRVAFCGAEPIRSATLARFAEAFAPAGFNGDALYPCYGLAESSLMVAGPDGPSGYVVREVERSALLKNRVVPVEAGDDSVEPVSLVGCGRARCDMEVKIVDPVTGKPCGADDVGEIWVHGDSLGQGYWNRPRLTKETFRARLTGGNGATYLRTGDLGFISDGELFVTGRLKDVIIIRGQNHYPQDIESTVAGSHDALLANSGAAFSVDTERGERLVAVHELDRQQRDADLDQVMRKIRVAVAMEHELDVYGIAIIRQASLPRTSSGKVQRNLCRQRFLDGELKIMAQWTRTSSPDSNGCFPQLNPGPLPLSDRQKTRLAERIESALLKWLQREAGIPSEELSRDTPFAELGLDSLTAVELSHQLENWLDIELTPIVAWNHPTPAALSIYLAHELAGGDDVDDLVADRAQSQSFAELLAEIESLSDAEAEATLSAEVKC